MTLECDVLVVGAGPAGLGAAITCSKNGLKTVLLEKNHEIGNPAKSSAFTWNEVINGWKIPETAISQRTTSFYIYSAYSKGEVEVNFKKKVGGTLNFHNFLQHLAFQAIKNGAKMIVGERAAEPLLDGDYVCGVKTGGGNEIKSRIVIDCSGPSAVVAKNAGLINKKKDSKIGIGLEYEMLNYKVRNQKAIEFYVGKNEVVPVGYGWVFPTGKNRAKVGISTVLNTGEKVENKNIAYYENRFLSEESPIYERVKNAQPFEMHTGAYSMDGFLEKTYTNGLLVAGDAASQASPLIGEGIRYALEFGKRAAETAAGAIKAKDVSEDYLKKYKEKCNNYLGEFYEVAADLIDVPTDEYWETLIESLTLMKKSRNTELALKYLRTEMTRKDAIKIFPSFKGKYL